MPNPKLRSQNWWYCSFFQHRTYELSLTSSTVNIPSCSSVVKIRRRFFFGVFINSGNMVRRPRISTNLLQFSFPSGPDIAWSNTLRDPFRDNFFSLHNIDSFNHYEANMNSHIWTSITSKQTWCVRTKNSVSNLMRASEVQTGRTAWQINLRQECQEFSLILLLSLFIIYNKKYHKIPAYIKKI